MVPGPRNLTWPHTSSSGASSLAAGLALPLRLALGLASQSYSREKKTGGVPLASAPLLCVKLWTFKRCKAALPSPRRVQRGVGRGKHAKKVGATTIEGHASNGLLVAEAAEDTHDNQDHEQHDAVAEHDESPDVVVVASPGRRCHRREPRGRRRRRIVRAVAAVGAVGAESQCDSQFE
eukprot:scaffold30096_cov69-Phaeocystis_antarctica.AAC.2